MTSSEPGYSNWSSIAQAIKTIASRNVRDGRDESLNSAILYARFDRFLSRVFADGENSEWVLKGGMGILARVTRARTTTDVDLASSLTDLDAAITALQQVANRDLGDHLRFDLVGTRPTSRGDNQPGVQTRKALFACYDADTGRKIGEIPIDVVVGPPPVGRIETIEPVNRLPLPKPLPSHPYRIYPVADQIADKVCATMTPAYSGGRPSSRVKDLVDLVIIARTQQVDLRELQLAIAAKQTLMDIPPITEFAIPTGWQTRYRALAGTTPTTGDLTDAHDAERLVAEMVRPALTSDAPPLAGARWTPDTGWTDSPDAGRLLPAGPDADADLIWIPPHSRSGRQVRGYYRSRRGGSST